MEKIRKILAIILFIMMFIFIALAFVSCDDASYRETQVNENPETGEITYAVRGITFHVISVWIPIPLGNGGISVYPFSI